MPRFRFSAKKIGLTYSCPQNAADNPIETSEELRDFLLSIFISGKYIVSRELHQSGKRHFHAFFYADENFETRDVRRFDFKGVHPNIVNKPGRPWEVYVSKAGDYVTNYFEEKSSVYERALALEGAGPALELIKSEKPRDFCLYGDRLRKNIEDHMQSKRRRPEPPLLNCWQISLVPDWRKALIFHGPPGIGKTRLAMSMGRNPLMIRHIDALRKMDSTTDLLVFDDMNFSQWPRSSVIHLVDMEDDSPIHMRYTNVVIPAGMRRIFTTNEKDVMFGVNLPDPAVQRRVEIYTFNNKLF